MTKKKNLKTDKVPEMTTASYVKENNRILLEIREHIFELTKDKRMILQEFMHMLADVYCWADDNRQYAYQFLQFPSDEGKKRLIDHIGTFYQFNDRMSLLDKMVAGDKGEYVKKDESKRKDIN